MSYHCPRQRGALCSGKYLFTSTRIGAINAKSANSRARSALADWANQAAGRSSNPFNHADDVLVVDSLAFDERDETAGRDLDEACRKHGVDWRHITFDGENKWLADVRVRADNEEDVGVLLRELDARKSQWGDTEDGCFLPEELTKLIEREHAAREYISPRVSSARR
jgi:hypothetical protein